MLEVAQEPRELLSRPKGAHGEVLNISPLPEFGPLGPHQPTMPSSVAVGVSLSELPFVPDAPCRHDMFIEEGLLCQIWWPDHGGDVSETRRVCGRAAPHTCSHCGRNVCDDHVECRGDPSDASKQVARCQLCTLSCGSFSRDGSLSLPEAMPSVLAATAPAEQSNHEAKHVLIYI